MSKKETVRIKSERVRSKPEKDFAGLTRRLLVYANVAAPRNLFLRVLSKHLVEGTGCDAVAIRTTDGDLSYRWYAEAGPRGELRFEMNYYKSPAEGEGFLTGGSDPALAEIRTAVFEGRAEAASPFFTEVGSFWTNDVSRPVVLEADGGRRELVVGGDYRSILIARFEIDGKNAGLLELLSRERDYFQDEDVGFLETVAQAIGVMVADRRAQRDLRERVKEIACLYGICQAAAKPEATLEEVLQRVAELLRRAFQFPEVAEAKVTLGSQGYETPGFGKVIKKIASDVTLDGETRGSLEVGYTEAKGYVEGFVFAPEERNLLDAVAKQFSLIAERRRAVEEKARMEEQLRHADRLATIGQLAAGIAHELNEPLLAVLGYTELVKKNADLPKEATADLDKVSAASLHAREIVKKLLIFARQVETRKTAVNLNDVVDEAFSWLGSRFADENIECVLNLNPKLRPFAADPAQLHQVVVNLVVNAIQATPRGGKVTVSTEADGEYLYLTVEDTGCGMGEEVQEQIFLPFFTTKDIGHGTGLGLAVVHGIVKAHGGTIGVRSEVGRGSRFVVILPIYPEEEKPEGRGNA